MLCESCAQIPFDAILSHEKVCFTIGDASEVKSRPHCVLCRICEAYLDNIENNVGDNAEYKTWLSIPQPCIFQMRSVRRLWFLNKADQDLDWLPMRMHWDVFLGPCAFIDLWKPVQFEIPPPPLFIQHRLIASGPFHLPVTTYEGKFLSSAHLQRIRNSALECQEHHRSCDANGFYSSPTFTFRLIDVLNRTVGPADHRSQYVALSYVWGSSARHNHQYLEGNSGNSTTKKLPEVIPKTLEDVLQVVRLLSLRFVWIDAYCVNQMDPRELQAAVENMDSVYENALLTICPLWADADSGLHGISRPFEGLFLPLGANYICSSFQSRHQLDNELINTPWHSRGWIYQESLLSRQRLCFMPSSILLQCQGQSLSSHYYTRVNTASDANTSEAFSDLQLRQCLRKSEWDTRAYQSIVESYTGRTLSRPSDALNAIRGILRRISKQTGMEFVQALPQADLLNALMWQLEISVQELQTRQFDSCRRWIFPSWSWMEYGKASFYRLWLTTGPTPLLHFYEGFFRPDVSFDVRVLRMAKLSIDLSIPQPTVLTIESEVVEAQMAQRFRAGCLWSFVHPRGQAVMDGLHSRLTRNANMGCLPIDSQIVPNLRVESDKCRVELVLLVHVAGVDDHEIKGQRTVGDTVIAMAVNRLKAPNTVERLGIIAVPAAFWAELRPKCCVLNIV
jgi:hypothetical protein